MMIVCTNAQILPLKSSKIPSNAAIDNASRLVGEGKASPEPAFAGALKDTLLREGGLFNFVLDYPEKEHARSL